ALLLLIRFEVAERIGLVLGRLSFLGIVISDLRVSFLHIFRHLGAFDRKIQVSATRGSHSLLDRLGDRIARLSFLLLLQSRYRIQAGESKFVQLTPKFPSLSCFSFQAIHLILSRHIGRALSRNLASLARSHHATDSN